MTMLAGSTLVGVGSPFSSSSYVHDRRYPARQDPASWFSRFSTHTRPSPEASLTAPLTRAGMDSIRVCVFHLSSSVASRQVSLPHECLACMFIDCLYYQVDLIGGDPNMALYRYSGTRQGSMDIKGGMYQSILTYFLDAWAQSPRCMPFCIPRAQHCSPKACCSLNSTRTRSASPTETVLRSTGILFPVWTRWSPLFWSGAIL